MRYFCLCLISSPSKTSKHTTNVWNCSLHTLFTQWRLLLLSDSYQVRIIKNYRRTVARSPAEERLSRLFSVSVFHRMRAKGECAGLNYQIWEVCIRNLDKNDGWVYGDEICSNSLKDHKSGWETYSMPILTCNHLSMPSCPDQQRQSDPPH